MANIVSLSGGKDSTAMLITMIDKGYNIDRIINVDTNKEFPEMYDHLKKLAEYIKPYKIETFVMDFDYYFYDYIKIKGKTKGQRGYGWCHPIGRWCTGKKTRLIKTNTSPEDIHYIGIAADEPNRLMKDKHKIYPMAEWGMTEYEALQLCYSRGFDFGGLYKEMNRVSCWCCPLQSIGDLRWLYNNKPKLWQELLYMDMRSYYSFRTGTELAKLNLRFKNEKSIS